MPSGTPSSTASIAARMPSDAVVGSPSRMMLVTLRSWYVYDGPRSPCSTPPIHNKYCCQAGLSRLYLAFRFSCTCAETGFSLSQGPPGVMCISVKVISETNSRTGTSHKMRRRMNRVTGQLPRQDLDLVEKQAAGIFVQRRQHQRTTVT